MVIILNGNHCKIYDASKHSFFRINKPGIYKTTFLNDHRTNNGLGIRES